MPTIAHRPRQAPSRRGVAISRSARSASSRPAGMRAPVLRRRRPQPSGMQKMVSKVVPGALSGKAASKTASKGRKPAGMALLAGAAGLAFKYRDKLSGMLRRRHEEPAVESNATVPPTHPGAGTPAAF